MTREKNHILEENKIRMSETAFVGNDINDSDCLKNAGMPIVVKDSHEDVLPFALYITKKDGGKGAVREICDLIEKVKKAEKNK